HRLDGAQFILLESFVDGESASQAVYGSISQRGRTRQRRIDHLVNPLGLTLFLDLERLHVTKRRHTRAVGAVNILTSSLPTRNVGGELIEATDRQELVSVYRLAALRFVVDTTELLILREPAMGLVVVIGFNDVTDREPL